MKKSKEIVHRVSAVYDWLVQQLSAGSTRAGRCDICGRCCDFESFGHRLFVTTPEILYLADKLGEQNIGQMTTGQCPWLQDGKCAIHRYRFADCRIFCCKGDAEFQADLSEAAVKKFKALCDEFQIPYRYVDLSIALQNFSPPKT